MEVREARPEELPDVGRVTQAAWLEYERRSDPSWERYFERLGDAAGRAQHALVLVAAADGHVVGTATVELDATLEGEPLARDHAGLRMVAVDPTCRGRGIGRLLVEVSLARMRAAGKRVAILQTTDEMLVAAALYRSLGFARDAANDMEVAPGIVLRGYRLALRKE